MGHQTLMDLSMTLTTKATKVSVCPWQSCLTLISLVAVRAKNKGTVFLKNVFLIFLLILEERKLGRERERGRDGAGRERLICCSTYLCIHWLILVLALTRDQTHSLGVLNDALTNWATWPGHKVFWLRAQWVAALTSQGEGYLVDKGCSGPVYPMNP